MTGEGKAVRGELPARPALHVRFAGLGSIFGKTVRDSRGAMLLIGGMGGLFMVAAAAPMALEFDTIEARRLLADQVALLPVAFRGLLGEPIAIDTLGGFLSWRVGNILPVILGIWSVVALSNSLAGEASKGSLDLLVSTPISRRRIALDKAMGHVVALATTMIAAAVLTFLAGMMFHTLPGDQIALTSVLGHFSLTGLLVLAAGSLAFALAPVLGRAPAAGLGYGALFGGYLIHAYAGMSSILEPFRMLSWYAWTADHRPLAGQSDWGPVAVLAAVCVGLLAVGTVTFDRRDIGSRIDTGRFALPSLPAGTGGPFRRQLADRSGTALGWGIGIGIFGAVMAASAEEFAATLGALPGLADMVRFIYPNVDITQASGVLQLTFFTFGLLLVGFAASSFLSGWAADEDRRRLDLVLSTPLSRARWAAATGSAVIAAVAIAAIVIAACIGLATTALGHDAFTPTLGIGVVALYAAAFAGIGLAVGGLVRPTLAAPVAGGLVIASFLVDLLGDAFNLPAAIVSLSLNRHLGQPMAGAYDMFGITIAAVMMVGGVAIGAVGLSRRDLRG